MSAGAPPPAWLDALRAALPGITVEQVTRFAPPAEGPRRWSAVLVLFAEGDAGPELLLIERATTMRSHAGQPAFPGGALDPDDGGPVAAALREAQEEVGLDPATVEVLGTLPDLWLPPSGFVVTPVLAWWREPHPVSAVDAAEVAAVHRVPLAVLADPATRLTVTHPSGWVGPAFAVPRAVDTAGDPAAGDLLVWGFTAGVLDRLLHFGGWERPWDSSRRRELDPERLALAARSSPAFAAAAPRTSPAVPGAAAGEDP